MCDSQIPAIVGTLVRYIYDYIVFRAWYTLSLVNINPPSFTQDQRCPLRSPTETLPTASDGWISTSLGEDRSKKSIQGCRVPGVVSLGVILITAVPQSPVEEGIKHQLISQFPKLHQAFQKLLIIDDQGQIKRGHIIS